MYYINVLYPLREHKVWHINLCGVCNDFIILNNSKWFGCKCIIRPKRIVT